MHRKPPRATEPRRLLAWALLVAIIGLSTDSAVAARSGADDQKLASPAELRTILKKVGKRMFKAEDALRGRDPGRVSNILQRIDEGMAAFQKGAGLLGLLEALDRGREAAGAQDRSAADAALLAIRPPMTALADYTVRRDAEVAYRAARQAATGGEFDAFLDRLAEFTAAVRPRTLMARVVEMRQAIARARGAMVRSDMPDGRAEVAAARAALNGLHYLGALSRALFELQIASEFMADRVPIAAREQLRRGMRELRAAIRVAPEEAGSELEASRDVLDLIQKRINKPHPDDAGSLETITGSLAALRDRLS